MLQFVISVTICNTRGVGNGSAGTSDCSKFSVNYMSTLIGLLKRRNPATLLRDKVAAVAIKPATSRTGRASLSRMRLQVGVCHSLLRGVGSPALPSVSRTVAPAGRDQDNPPASTNDTAAFAVNSIRQWWLTVGRARYPNASRMTIASIAV